MPITNDAASSLASSERLAARLRGFGPLGILAILVILAGGSLVQPLGAVLVLAWAWASRTPWREIGYVRPRSWWITAVAGIACGAAFKLAMKSIVMPLLGAPPINPAYHYLAGNASALPGALLAVVVGAGFGEETVFRSWMFERLGRLFGSGAAAKVLIVLLTSALFAAAHYSSQGLAGTEQALVTGLAFGTFFAITRSIVPVMFAHAAFDVTAVAIIYWDLETRVAHWFFR